MAKKEKNYASQSELAVDETEDFSSELISSLNKEFGTRVAFNLATDESPTHIKRWISTGCRMLDYISSNRRQGGFPEGRIIEIAGPPSIGKSHIAFALAKNVQSMGGLVVYIDTENAVPIEKLGEMGIDISKRFVYCDTHCTEEVFSIMESTITKAKQVASTKDIPILIVWDSVAATSPKQEIDGEYDKDTMGLQARVIAKGLRKITGVIGQNNVTLLVLNQLKSKVGVVYGDPTYTPGGQGIPYHASVRIRLLGGAQIKDKDGNVVGISVKAKTVKNKVARPFREAEFDIVFGHGIVENDQLFDVLRQHCEADGPIVFDGKQHTIEGTGAWKVFTVASATTGEVILEKKFNKSQFGELLSDPKMGPILENMLERSLVISSAINEAELTKEAAN
jgi:recombination protein RecA